MAARSQLAAQVDIVNPPDDYLPPCSIGFPRHSSARSRPFLHPAPEPLLHMQPEKEFSQKGQFSSQLVNSGTDIDNVGVKYEYFVAQKQAGKVTVFKVAEVGDPSIAPLRTNQQRPINIWFLGASTSMCRYLRSKNIAPLAGVKITVSFRRYSDEKDFVRDWIYGTEKMFDRNYVPIAVYQPGTAFDTLGPPEVRNDMVTYLK